MSDFDLNELMAKAQGMAAGLQEQQEAAEATTVTGQAGGGVVSIEMTGTGRCVDVTISKEVVDPDDVGMLEDLVVAALNDAATQAAELAGGGVESMLGGLDIGGMLGALGGGGAAGAGALGDLLGGLAGGDAPAGDEDE